MKHAVTILAHSNPETNKRLMRMLDDERFVFILFLDIKSQFNFDDYNPGLKHARFIPVKTRFAVNWASWSEILAEFELLKVALMEGVDYIHFCQGADLPLKRANYIDRFFEKNKGREFIDCHITKKGTVSMYCKFPFYNLSIYRNTKWLHYVNHFIAYMQRPLIGRKKAFWGSAMYSIDREFAEYLLHNAGEIERRFKWCRCPSELILQNVAMESDKFKDRVVKNNLRLINPRKNEAKSPDFFRDCDKEIIREGIENKKVFFSRKFSDNDSVDIAQYVEDSVK